MSGRETAARASALESLLDLLRVASVERLLAGSRLFAAAVLLVVVASDTGGPFHPTAVKLLMAGYTAYAAGVLIVVWWRVVPLRSGNHLHTLDLAWATVATSVSGGTSSMVFPLFALVLAGGAYRGGIRRTFIDMGIVGAIASAQAAAALAGLTPWPFELDLFVLRVSYVAMLAVLFGVLSERRHSMSFQAATLGRLLLGVGRAGDIRSALGDTLDEFLGAFGASQALLVVHELETRRLYLWRAERNAGAAAAVSVVELQAEDLNRWFFPVPSSVATLEVRSSRAAGPASVQFALDADGGVIRESPAAPVSLPIPGAWRSSIAAVIDGKGTLDARLFLVDPGHPRRRETRLAVLATLVRQVTPALLSLYLLRRLRSRAGLRERARLSAELHDGLIQTLTALEIRLELLGRGAGATDATVAAEVASARDVLHEEALRARELMERLRPVEGDVDRFPSALEGMIRRFSGASGMAARLDWTGDTLDLTPRQCREVLRIVQEALVNARRHSGASQVVVRLAADQYDWVLTAEDNGRGLGFTGRLTHEQIEREQTGPNVIRQRVDALGGTLNIESSPAGLRLEVAWPRARRV